MELDYQIKPRRRMKINIRLIVFLAVICIPFVWFFATFVTEARSGGIQDHGDYVSVNLKALGQFPFDSDNGSLSDVPNRFRELDGKRVALEGFLYPVTSAGPKTASCQFVYNIQKCCFNGPPQVQERVFIEANPNKKFRYYDSEVRVTGKLHVGIKRNDIGTVISVYELVPDSVIPVS